MARSDPPAGAGLSRPRHPRMGNARHGPVLFHFGRLDESERRGSAVFRQMGVGGLGDGCAMERGAGAGILYAVAGKGDGDPLATGVLNPRTGEDEPGFRMAYEPAWLAGQIATIYLPWLFASLLTKIRLTRFKWLEIILLGFAYCSCSQPTHAADCSRQALHWSSHFSSRAAMKCVERGIGSFNAIGC